jgi:hypothetical protein
VLCEDSGGASLIILRQSIRVGLAPMAADRPLAVGFRVRALGPQASARYRVAAATVPAATDQVEWDRVAESAARARPVAAVARQVAADLYSDCGSIKVSFVCSLKNDDGREHEPTSSAHLPKPNLIKASSGFKHGWAG